jgi:hypothetical protein
MDEGDMRVQLLADHVFQLTGGRMIMLHSGSFIGANPGDYPVSQLANFTVTTGMAALDAPATTAVGAEQTRLSTVNIPPGQGKTSGLPVPQPHKGATVQAGYSN